MDIWLVRKLGVPDHEELAMGAMAGGNIYVLNPDIIRLLHIDQEAIDQVIKREKIELDRRNTVYRQAKPPADVAGKTVIVVDDGLATGATMRAAIVSLRAAGATWIVAASPVASVSGCLEAKREADEVFCLYTPEPFYGVGLWYEDFSEVTDKETRALLRKEDWHESRIGP
jgi:predicted phosphoribosyltransferase